MILSIHGNLKKTFYFSSFQIIILQSCTVYYTTGQYSTSVCFSNWPNHGVWSDNIQLTPSGAPPPAPATYATYTFAALSNEQLQKCGLYSHLISCLQDILSS